MTPKQRESALKLLRLMAYDDGPKWRDLIGGKDRMSFLDFWLRWRTEAQELLFELDLSPIRTAGPKPRAAP